MPSYIWDAADISHKRSIGSTKAHKNLVNLSNVMRSCYDMGKFNEDVFRVGDEWIASTLTHASSIFEQCNSMSATDMPFTPGDLLKTPSRKRGIKQKKRVAVQGLPAPTLSEDKENVPSPQRAVSVTSRQPPATGISRATRSKADKSTLITLQNPYQTKPKTKSRTSSSTMQSAQDKSNRNAQPSIVLSQEEEGITGPESALSSPKISTAPPSGATSDASAADKQSIVGSADMDSHHSEEVAHESTYVAATEDREVASNQSLPVLLSENSNAHSQSQESVVKPLPATEAGVTANAKAISPVQDDKCASEESQFALSSPITTPRPFRANSHTEEVEESFTQSTGPAVTANETASVLGTASDEEQSGNDAVVDMAAAGTRQISPEPSTTIVPSTESVGALQQDASIAHPSESAQPVLNTRSGPPRSTPAGNQYRSSFFIKTLEQQAAAKREDDSDENDDEIEQSRTSQDGETESNTAANSGPTDALPQKRKSAESQQDTKKAMKTGHSSTAPQEVLRSTRGPDNLASLRERLDLAARASTTQQGRATTMVATADIKSPLWTSRSSSTRSSRDERIGKPVVERLASETPTTTDAAGDDAWEDEDEIQAIVAKPLDIKATSADFVAAVRAATSTTTSATLTERKQTTPQPNTSATTRSPSKLPLLRTNSAVHDLVEKFELTAASSTTAWGSAGKDRVSKLPIPSPTSPYKTSVATAQTSVNAVTATGSATPAKSPVKHSEPIVETAATQKLAIVVQAHHYDEAEADEEDTASEGSDSDSEHVVDAADSEALNKSTSRLVGAEGKVERLVDNTDTDAELLGPEKSDVEEVRTTQEDSSDTDLVIDELASSKKRTVPATVKPPKGNSSAASSHKNASVATLRAFPSSNASTSAATSTGAASVAAGARSGWSLNLKGLFGMGSTTATSASTAQHHPSVPGTNGTSSFMPSAKNGTRPALPGANPKTSKPAPAAIPGTSVSANTNKPKSLKLAEQARRQDQTKKDARARPLAPEVKKREREQEREAGPVAKAIPSVKPAGASVYGKASSSSGPAKKKLRLTPEAEVPTSRPVNQAIHHSTLPRPPKGKQPMTSHASSSTIRAVDTQTIRSVGAPGGLPSNAKGFDVTSQPIRFAQGVPGPSTASNAPSQKQVVRPANPFQKQHAQPPPAIARPTQTLVSREPSPEPELEEINSEYSDSEDEATQQKRAKDAPWTRGPLLAVALEAQERINADIIFGFPKGDVPIDSMLPTGGQMRPRSSSANWSGADGLTQKEIDEDNQRRGIVGQRVLMPKSFHGPSGSTSANNGRRAGPSGAGSRVSHATSNGSLF